MEACTSIASSPVGQKGSWANVASEQVLAVDEGEAPST